ncbi:MAG: hypothetical protein IKW15_04275 [Bacteroidales bacterium]|nr:hypothetical protein [Bacteroidales bacterium]
MKANNREFVTRLDKKRVELEPVCNCGTCAHFIKGKLCKKLSVRINERDLEVEIKCKYYAHDYQKSKKALGERKETI